MIYFLCVLGGVLVGMMVMSLCAVGKITDLDGEVAALRNRLVAAYRLFDAYGIKLR